MRRSCRVENTVFGGVQLRITGAVDAVMLRQVLSGLS
jgi:hypothetical protein